jgi:hypothetical protein
MDGGVMAACDCCGCIFESDYGTSIITGTGTKPDPYQISIVDTAWIRPAARVRRAALQAIPTGAAFTAITFDTEVFDQGGNFWVVAAPTRLTIPLSGLYIFGGCGIWAGNATGTRELGVRLNGSTIIAVNDQPPDATSGAGNTPWQQITYQKILGEGDYLELVARQESGGSLNMTAEADDAIVFWIVYAGRTI